VFRVVHATAFFRRISRAGKICRRLAGKAAEAGE
jgi:hypothetical protein